MSRSPSFSRQFAAYQYLNSSTLNRQPAHQVRQTPRLYSLVPIQKRVAVIGQSSLAPIGRNGSLFSSTSQSPFPISSRVTVSKRLAHNSAKGSKKDNSINKGAKASWFGLIAGRDYVNVKIGGGTALVLATGFGGLYLCCENHTEGELCSRFRDFLGLKKKLNKLPSQADFYVPRFAPQQRIQELFEEENNKKAIVAIVGDSGRGKSEVVKEYAHAKKDDYRHVWFFDANTWKQAYKDLFFERKLLEESDGDIDQIHIDVIVSRVHQDLERQTLLGKKRSLIIIDNASKSFIAENLKWQLPENTNILITSKERGFEFQLDLTNDKSCALSTEEAAKIFLKRLPKLTNEEQAEVRKIIRKFENLPVLLAQAANYLSTYEISPQEYLAKFEENKIIILNQGGLEGTTGPRKLTDKEKKGLSDDQINQIEEGLVNLYTSIFLTLKVIREQSPKALALLLYCAYLPHHSIPRKLLEKLTTDSNELNARLVELQTLITLDQETVSLHEAIQEIVLDVGDPLSSNRKHDQGVILSNLGEIALDFKPFIDQAPPKAKMIYQQAIADMHQSTTFSDIREQIAKAAQHLSSWVYPSSPSSIFSLEIPNITEHSKQKRLADLHSALGNVQHGLLKWNEALEEKRKALTLYQILHGEKHLDVARSYNSVGNTLGELGWHEEALECKSTALMLRKELFGEKHPDVARSYNNVGRTFGELGRHEEALELNSKAMELRKELFGEKHPDVAESYNNVGLNLGKLGRHEEALELKSKALELVKDHFGTKHPDVAISYNNVGMALRDLGRHEEALEYLSKASELIKELFGEKHYYVAMSYNNIGLTLGDLGRHEEALECKSKALELVKDHFGTKHPLVARSYNNVGNTLGDLGRHEEALEFKSKALKLIKDCFGTKHPDVAKSYQSVGLTLEELGRYEDALKHLLQSFKMYCQCFELHPDHALAFENTLVGIAAISDSKLKAKTKQELIEVCVEKFGQDHEFTLKAKSIQT